MSLISFSFESVMRTSLNSNSLTSLNSTNNNNSKSQIVYQSALMNSWALEHISIADKMLEEKKWLTDEEEFSQIIKESNFSFPICFPDMFTETHFKHYASVAQVEKKKREMNNFQSVSN